MSIYTPDCWTVLEFRSRYGIHRKVFAGWYGGYLGSDSWKLSSGITKVTEFPNHYEFLNNSGSLYVCHKNVQRMNSYMSNILLGWHEQAKKVENSEDNFVIEDVSNEYV